MDTVDGSYLDADLQADSEAQPELILPRGRHMPGGKILPTQNPGKETQNCDSTDSGCVSGYVSGCVENLTSSITSIRIDSGTDSSHVTSHNSADDKVLDNVTSDTDSCLGPSLGSIPSVPGLEGAGELNEMASVSYGSAQENELDEEDVRYFRFVRKFYSQDEDGDTTLHVAIIQNDVKSAEQIISLAPQPEYLNIQNSLRQTPLHLAAITDQCTLLRLLILQGACIDLRDKDGNTALHLACARGHIRCVRSLTKVLSTEEAANFESWESTNEMTLPQDTTLQNYEGLTCLHVAAENGHYEIVEYLVSPKFGASVDQKDGCSGRTILHHAVERHNIQMLVFLITRCKADVNARTFDNHTPLQLAAGRQYVDVANALIRAGADKEQLYESDADDDEEDEEMDDDTERT